MYGITHLSSNDDIHMYVCQFLSGLPVFSVCAMRSCDFALPAQGEEVLALKIKQILLPDRRPGCDLAAAHHFGQMRRDRHVMIAGIFTLAQHVDAEAQRRKNAFAGSGNVGDGQRCAIASLGQRDGARFCIVQHASRFIVMPSDGRSRRRSRASNADVETLARAMFSKMVRIA